MDDEHARQIARNEVLFRRVNERISELNTAIGEITGTIDLVCECGDAVCIERIILDLPAYDQLRSDPTQFVVRPGHEQPSVETVIHEHDRYFFVRKHGAVPDTIAREADPRRSDAVSEQN